MKTLKKLIEQKIVEWKGKTLASHEQFEVELRLTLQEIAQATAEALSVEEKEVQDPGVLMEIDLGNTTIGDIDKMCGKNRDIGFNEAVSAQKEKVKEFFEV